MKTSSFAGSRLVPTPVNETKKPQERLWPQTEGPIKELRDIPQPPQRVLQTVVLLEQREPSPEPLESPQREEFVDARSWLGGWRGRVDNDAVLLLSPLPTIRDQEEESPAPLVEGAFPRPSPVSSRKQHCSSTPSLCALSRFETSFFLISEAQAVEKKADNALEGQSRTDCLLWLDGFPGQRRPRPSVAPPRLLPVAPPRPQAAAFPPPQASPRPPSPASPPSSSSTLPPPSPARKEPLHSISSLLSTSRVVPEREPPPPTPPVVQDIKKSIQLAQSVVVKAPPPVEAPAPPAPPLPPPEPPQVAPSPPEMPPIAPAEPSVVPPEPKTLEQPPPSKSVETPPEQPEAVEAKAAASMVVPGPELTKSNASIKQVPMESMVVQPIAPAVEGQGPQSDGCNVAEEPLQGSGDDVVVTLQSVAESKRIIQKWTKAAIRITGYQRMYYKFAHAFALGVVKTRTYCVLFHDGEDLDYVRFLRLRHRRTFTLHGSLPLK